MAKGSEALEQPKKKSEKKPAKKAGPKLSEIRIRPLADGTHHIIHHHEDEHGIPHHHTPEYSAASKEDVAEHVMQHLPDAAQGQDPDAQPGAQPGADPAAAAAGPQPGAGGAEMPE